MFRDVRRRAARTLAGMNSAVHPVVARVADAVAARSRRGRTRYLREVAGRSGRRPSPIRRRVSVLPASGGVAHSGVAAAAHVVGQTLSGMGAAPRAVPVPVWCRSARHVDGVDLPLSPQVEVAVRTTAALLDDVDAAVLIAVCDAVTPAMVLGAAQVGHLPAVVVGHAEPGTSPVLGVLWQALGLQDDDAGDPHPTWLGAAVQRVTRPGACPPLAEVLDASAVVDGVVAVLATGGSVRHLMYVVALAATVGVDLCWSDVEALSTVVPTRHARVSELRAAGLLRAGAPLRPPPCPAPDGGQGGSFHVVTGNLGEAVVDVSRVPATLRVVHSPARVFDDVRVLRSALRSGGLHRDAVVVLRGLGPSSSEADGPVAELVRIAERGHRLALVTDGGLAARPGSLPTAALVTPHSGAGGAIGRVRNGDEMCLDTYAGTLQLLVPLDPHRGPPAA